MGDRVGCNLNLFGVISIPDYERLYKALDDYGFSDSEDPNWFYFSEINYAKLPDDIEDVLIELKIPFTWKWNEGGGYGAGIIYFDGASLMEFPYQNDVGVCLALDTMKNEDLRNEALAFLAKFDELKPLEVISE